MRGPQEASQTPTCRDAGILVWVGRPGDAELTGKQALPRPGVWGPGGEHAHREPSLRTGPGQTELGRGRCPGRRGHSGRWGLGGTPGP